MPPLQYLFVGERITENIDPEMVIDDKIRSKKIRQRLQKKLLLKKLLLKKLDKIFNPHTPSHRKN